jgi:hypothetical protein
LRITSPLWRIISRLLRIGRFLFRIFGRARQVIDEARGAKLVAAVVALDARQARVAATFVPILTVTATRALGFARSHAVRARAMRTLVEIVLDSSGADVSAANVAAAATHQVAPAHPHAALVAQRFDADDAQQRRKRTFAASRAAR